MVEIEQVDIKENKILKLSPAILEILLKDRTTNKNIIWATNNHAYRGGGYLFHEEVLISLITGYNGEVIRPRTAKSKKEQKDRVRQNAEVFTPSWMCNLQNNLVDEEWFGYKEVFNKTKDKNWKTLKRKVKFDKDEKWKEYVTLKRLEISCGEAPYIVSRYDTVTGEVIEVKDRIGLLDRKLRIINENTIDVVNWFKWVVEAYKSVYGYEWQGDNLLLARENLLYTFRDNYILKFGDFPNEEKELEIAEIISWNFWQMDGIKYVVPNSCKDEVSSQLSLFEENIKREQCKGCKNNNIKTHNGTYSKIKNWETGRKIKFVSLVSKEGI